MTLDLVFSAAYAVGFLFLLVLELVGVHSKRKGDTITENWRYLDTHLHGPLQWGWGFGPLPVSCTTQVASPSRPSAATGNTATLPLL